MENINKPRISRVTVSEVRRRWKTLLALTIVASSSFIVGGYANRVVVGMVQSIAGNHVIVPPPELQIVQTTWSIDPIKSIVTDVDLLVTTNSPVWQLKLYQIHVQVSCLDLTVKPPVEIICAAGSVSVVLPTHGIGLRPVKVMLDKPIDPETNEIHDLNFIVTDLARIPPQPPTILIGPDNPQVTLQQGGSVRVPIVVVGVGGVAAGTQVMVTSTPSGPGVTQSPGQTLTLQASPKMPGVVMADSFFDVFADASAPVGQSEDSLLVTNLNNEILDKSLLWVNVIPIPPPGELPNLMFPNCPPPPTVNVLTDCLRIHPLPTGTAVDLVVKNNGPVATPVATTVVATGDATCSNPSANCAVPVLAPGATTTVTVVCERFNPDCNFGVTIDPNPPNIVVESNEADNDMLGLVLG